MKLAITYENNEVFQHFGRCQQFKIYEIKDHSISNSYILETKGIGHGALAGLLQENQVELLICGGIGQGARIALAQANIQVIPGVIGNCDEQVSAYLLGTLAYNLNVECHHHDHEHTCNHSHLVGKCGL